MAEIQITDGLRELIYALEELRASHPEHVAVRPAVKKVMPPDGFVMELPDGSSWTVVAYEQSGE